MSRSALRWNSIRNRTLPPSAEDEREAEGAPPEDDRKSTRTDDQQPEQYQKTARKPGATAGKPPEPLPLPDRILGLLRQNPHRRLANANDYLLKGVINQADFNDSGSLLLKAAAEAPNGLTIYGQDAGNSATASRIF